ncbi:MAG: uracil-DNA glycosylase family protein [Acidimicrobiia bacterium]
MAHDFDPGYPRRFTALVRNYPGPEIYPPTDFRTEWGPIFHRGRLDGSARVLVIGQDPATHETVVRRILVGEAGQRVQGFLAKLGITRSYVMVNAFLYSVLGQGGGERHKKDPAIAAYRNQWLDKLLVDSQVQAVVTLGRLAAEAFAMWRATPAGASSTVAHAAITHPTFPESASAAGQTTKIEAIRIMLENWNIGLQTLVPHISDPDVHVSLVRYGSKLEDDDLAPIPEFDMPAGMPPWMRSLDAWAERAATGRAALKTATAEQKREAKRATLVVEIPRTERIWNQ